MLFLWSLQPTEYPAHLAPRVQRLPLPLLLQLPWLFILIPVLSPLYVCTPLHRIPAPWASKGVRERGMVVMRGFPCAFAEMRRSPASRARESTGIAIHGMTEKPTPAGDALSIRVSRFSSSPAGHSNL